MQYFCFRKKQSFTDIPPEDTHKDQNVKRKRIPYVLPNSPDTINQNQYFPLER